MNLINVYEYEEAPQILYELLKERKPWQSIRHSQLPTYEKHVDFFYSIPYSVWYLIEIGDVIVGATYITKNKEVGIAIFEQFAGNGFGENAIRLLKTKHHGPLYANVSPFNGQSHFLFSHKLNGKVVQVTYEI